MMANIQKEQEFQETSEETKLELTEHHESKKQDKYFTDVAPSHSSLIVQNMISDGEALEDKNYQQSLKYENEQSNKSEKILPDSMLSHQNKQKEFELIKERFDNKSSEPIVTENKSEWNDEKKGLKSFADKHCIENVNVPNNSEMMEKTCELDVNPKMVGILQQSALHGSKNSLCKQSEIEEAEEIPIANTFVKYRFNMTEQYLIEEHSNNNHSKTDVNENFAGILDESNSYIITSNEVVRDLLEELIIQCCDIMQDISVSINDKVVCESKKNIECMFVPFSQKNINCQHALQDKTITGPFCDNYVQGVHKRNVCGSVLKKYDSNDLYIPVPLNSEQPKDDYNLINYKFDKSVTIKTSDVSLPSTNSQTKADLDSIDESSTCVVDKIQDVANACNLPEDYNRKAQILKEINREKIDQMFTKINNNEQLNENDMNNCNYPATLINVQESVESDSYLQTFESGDESIESEIEMPGSPVLLEGYENKSNNLNMDMLENNLCRFESLEKNNTSIRSTAIDSPGLDCNCCCKQVDLICEIRKDSHFKVEDEVETRVICDNLKHNGKTVIIKETSNSYQDTKLENEKFRELTTVNEDFICHFEIKQKDLEEKPNNLLSRMLCSSLIQNVSKDDTASANRGNIQPSAICLEENQKSSSNVQEINIGLNSLSNSRSQLQEFYLPHETNESEVFKKQLAAENVHPKKDSDDAKLQVQQTPSIYKDSSVKDMEPTGENKQNNQQSDITGVGSKRKITIEETCIENEEPCSKVPFILHNSKFEYLSYKEQISEREHNQKGTEDVNNFDLKTTEVNIAKCEEVETNEEMDQAVPVSCSNDISVYDDFHGAATETFYNQSDFKKMDKVCEKDTSFSCMHMKKCSQIARSLSIIETGTSAEDEDNDTNNSTQVVFKWKYVPSIETDSVVPNIDGNEDNDKLLMPNLLKSCKKPYRLGLSKRQKLPSLHPKLKKI